MAIYIVNSGTTSTEPDPNAPQMDLSNAVDGSLIYYNAQNLAFRADQDVTRTTLTDGGNF